MNYSEIMYSVSEIKWSLYTSDIFGIRFWQVPQSVSTEVNNVFDIPAEMCYLIVL